MNTTISQTELEWLFHLRNGLNELYTDLLTNKERGIVDGNAWWKMYMDKVPIIIQKTPETFAFEESVNSRDVQTVIQSTIDFIRSNDFISSDQNYSFEGILASGDHLFPISLLLNRVKDRVSQEQKPSWISVILKFSFIKQLVPTLMNPSISLEAQKQMLANSRQSSSDDGGGGMGDIFGGMMGMFGSMAGEGGLPFPPEFMQAIASGDEEALSKIDFIAVMTGVIDKLTELRDKMVAEKEEAENQIEE